MGDMGDDAARCDICREPVVWPSHYGDWECPHCHQSYEYDEGLRITLTDTQWAMLRKPPRWIPVSERLPEEDRDVVVFTNEGTYVAAMDEDGIWCPSHGDGWMFPEPTHWMPLPAPPEVTT